MLLPYDFYDLYAVLIAVRAIPNAPYNLDIASSLEELLAHASETDWGENAVRRVLADIEGLDDALYSWVYVQNKYTYVKIVKDPLAYSVLAEGFRELRLAMEEGSTERAEALADALHNVPLLFAEGADGIKARITREISHYSKKWNASFLIAFLR